MKPSFPVLQTAASLLVVLLLAGCAAPRSAPVGFVHGPYKDVTLAFDPQTHLLSTELLGRRQPITEVLSPGATVSWGFAKGECGAETLGGLDAEAVARANVAAFRSAGIGYIVSTGGEGGTFTCSSEAGMEAFIRRYDSPWLVGIDFDIEAAQTPEQIMALVQSVKAVQGRIRNCDSASRWQATQRSMGLAAASIAWARRCWRRSTQLGWRISASTSWS